MEKRCINRLLVVGPKTAIKPFAENLSLETELEARFIEGLEFSVTRQAWQFETFAAPLESLKRLSARYPLLVFLLDYERLDQRSKGLAKAKGGMLANHQVSY